jgi:hypothetical protein
MSNAITSSIEEVVLLVTAVTLFVTAGDGDAGSVSVSGGVSRGQVASSWVQNGR